jgi:hypothetical protein
MQTTADTSTNHIIGELRVGGDWACAHGDLDALCHVARRLAEHAREPLHSELIALATACHRDPDHAVVIWTRLKERLHG